jgi:hypothetical protein
MGIRMPTMRMRTLLAACLLAVASAAFAPSARGSVRGPWPAYLWVLRADVVVAGRVASVGERSGTLRVTKTIAGEPVTETIAFTPVTHPECMSGRIGTGERQEADVAVGDEVALFLATGKDGTFEVVDGGYAKVRTGDGRAWCKAALSDVERLVAILRTSDVDARDRGMIGAVTADGEFLRRAACRYVRSALGLAAPPEERYSDEGAAAPSHLDAVRRNATALAALVRRENGEEPCSAALAALADATCAPDGAFDAIVRYARATADLGQEGFGSACRVIALYDRADAVAAIVELSARRPQVLACLGASPRPEARKRLVEEFDGDDFERGVAAINGLSEVLARTRDAAVEQALLARLRSHVGPTMEEALGAALMRTRGLDAANAILDEMAADTLSKPREDVGAKLLRAYLGAKPEVAGVREVLVKRQDVLIRRLDAGKTESVWPLYLLQELGTPEAMAALRRAAETFPDPEIRQGAKWRSEPLGR